MAFLKKKKEIMNLLADISCLVKFQHVEQILTSTIHEITKTIYLPFFDFGLRSFEGEPSLVEELGSQ